jgi:hypothetical protein
MAEIVEASPFAQEFLHRLTAFDGPEPIQKVSGHSDV